MKRLDIKVGFLCNNNCKFCVQGDKRIFFKNKNIKDLKDILSRNRTNADSVVFTGGEATIRKDIGQLIKLADSFGYKNIQIQTNGRMFAYKDFCEEMIEFGATEFAIAIHGHNEKIHDFLTSKNGSFKQTVLGIKNLKNFSQSVLTNTVITTYNYKFLPVIAKFLVDLNVDQFQFAFPHIAGRAAENKEWLIPKKIQVIEYVKKGLDIGIKAGKKVTTEAIPYCFMEDHKDCIAERFIPETKVFDSSFMIDNFTHYRMSEGKMKRAECNKCAYNNICEGPWKEYPQLYGWEEFKPVLKTKKLNNNGKK